MKTYTHFFYSQSDAIVREYLFGFRKSTQRRRKSCLPLHATETEKYTP